MMPNVTRGDRAAGLFSYLAGPGRANEHSNPHLVAGDSAVMAWHSNDTLTHAAALEVARYVDAPQRAFGTQVSRGHLWHCSLSLSAEEGALGDEKWEAIAEDFIRGMDFDDNEGTKAPCRWVAVHHGPSKNGNDHIHIVVDLVREDGTKAAVHRDFAKAQNVARALEVKYGLEQLESQRIGAATRGYHPAERDAQARARARALYARTERAAVTPWSMLPASERTALAGAQVDVVEPRYRLAVAVRGYAAASRTEDEFVRRARRGGLLIRPRFAEGSNTVVTGYSVARRPIAGERPIWYGGGRLARDLTLSRLRDGWDASTSDSARIGDEWRAAYLGKRCTTVGRESFEPHAEGLAAHSARLAKVVDVLHGVSDAEAKYWAIVSHQTAGALAAWSNATEQEPGDLAQLSRVVAKSAQTYQRPPAPDKIDTIAINGAAMLMASAVRGGQGKAAQAALVRQIVRLVHTVIEGMEVNRQVRLAEQARDLARTRLAAVAHSYVAASPVPVKEPVAYGTTSRETAPLKPAAQAILDRLERPGSASGARSRSVLPSDLTRAKQTQSTPSANVGRGRE